MDDDDATALSCGFRIGSGDRFAVVCIESGVVRDLLLSLLLLLSPCPVELEDDEGAIGVELEDMIEAEVEITGVTAVVVDDIVVHLCCED